jgi:UDP-N-acetyl-2-amino-2-deoxyglucuronate dehydrogenase
LSNVLKNKRKDYANTITEIIEVEDSAMGTALIDERVPVVIFASNNFSSDPSPSVLFDFEEAMVELKK